MATADSNLHWARPGKPGGTGALVLAGSSGRLEVARAQMLASLGVTALAVRWFGGDGQPTVPCEIPLETFTEAIDDLAGECRRIVLLGMSYGAEAALLTATIDDRVDAVVALAPTDVAWEGQHEHDDDPRRSKWTLSGEPVPFVPFDRTWQPPVPPAFVDGYQRSRERAGRAVVEEATIPVERIRERRSSSRAATTRCGPAAWPPGTSLQGGPAPVWRRRSSKTRRRATPSCCRARHRPT